MIHPDDTLDYEVGYKKPPKSRQFKKGQSGNPKGRPKKHKSVRKLLAKELDQLIEVTEDGVTKKISKREAWIKRLVNNGISAKSAESIRAFKLLEALAPDEMLASDDERTDSIEVIFVESDGDGRPLNLTDEEREHILQRRKRHASEADCEEDADFSFLD